MKQRQTHRATENGHMVAEGEGAGGKDWESGISRYKPVCRMVKQRRVTQGTPFQHPVRNRDGKNMKKNACL